MCDDGTKKILALLQDMQDGRPPIDRLVMLSSSQAYILDYQNRKHVYVWSPNVITLTLEDLGNIVLPQYEWVNLGFTTGMRIYASGQSSTVPLFIRCTDEVVP